MKAIAAGLLGMAVLAGCASAPETGGPALVVAAAPNCDKLADAPTGSSIRRRDCSGNANVQSVDAKELMDQRRTALPNVR